MIRRCLSHLSVTVGLSRSRERDVLHGGLTVPKVSSRSSASGSHCVRVHNAAAPATLPSELPVAAPTHQEGVWMSQEKHFFILESTRGPGHACGAAHKYGQFA